MKVLITGGAGFVGSYCVDAFLAAGHDVVIYDRTAPVHTPSVSYIVGDLLDSSAVANAVAPCDLVIHAGGLLGTHETVVSAIDTVNANIVGTLNVLQATTRNECKLICISKPNVWLNPYSITKDCSEKFCMMYVAEFNAKISVVKLYNVYGPRQKYSHVRKAIPTWIVDAFNERPVEVYGSGFATVDLIHARDAARGILEIAESFDACRLRPTVEIASDIFGSFPKHNEQILELGSGYDISVNACIEALRAEMEIPTVVSYVPMRRGEIDGTKLRANLARVSSLTGFAPSIELNAGFRETIEYYRTRLQDVAQGLL